MQAHGLLFDLDGTLADTLDDIAAAMDHVLCAMGLRALGRQAYRGLVGDGAAALVRNALPEGRGELQERALDAFRQRYSDHLLDNTRPYPGIAALLKELQGRKVPLAVLSNKPHEFTQTIVTALFPAIRFADVTGQRPLGPCKPDPSCVRKSAATMGLRPQRCAMVGDGPTDMASAVSAGALAVGVTWGYRSEAELFDAGAALVIHRPEDLTQPLVWARLLGSH